MLRIAAIAVILLGMSGACSRGTATDSAPTNIDDARQLAETVASNASCGGFEDLGVGPTRDTWVFTCQKSAASFEITVFGSQDARFAGIKALDDRHDTYFARNTYAVTVASAEGFSSPDSALASFKQ